MVLGRYLIVGYLDLLGNDRSFCLCRLVGCYRWRPAIRLPASQKAAESALHNGPVPHKKRV